MDGKAILVLLSPDDRENTRRVLLGSLVDGSVDGLAVVNAQEYLPQGVRVAIQLSIACDVAGVQGAVVSCTKQINHYRLGILLEFTGS